MLCDLQHTVAVTLVTTAHIAAHFALVTASGA
jgi:hypothetical protein